MNNTKIAEYKRRLEAVEKAVYDLSSIKDDYDYDCEIILSTSKTYKGSENVDAYIEYYDFNEDSPISSVKLVDLLRTELDGAGYLGEYKNDFNPKLFEGYSSTWTKEKASDYTKSYFLVAMLARAYDEWEEKYKNAIADEMEAAILRKSK